MGQKKNVGYVVFTGVVVISALGLLAFGFHANMQNYFTQTIIPGIVEGTAVMFDSEAYFTKNSLTEFSAEIDIDCHDKNQLALYVGYKTSSYDLLDVSHPSKEVCLWDGGDLHPSKSTPLLETQQSSLAQNKLSMKWDLLGVDFSKAEYVKADERIWYLRIKTMSEGPYGYEVNVTEEINGTLVTLPEYIPNINILNKFELTLNDIRFHTLLHPVFDSSCDVVVVIRGVNHELGAEDGYNSEELNLHQQASTWSSTSPPGSNGHWVIVFATEDYVNQGSVTDAIFFVHGAYLFIFGEHPNSICNHPNGMYDYGYKIMYCMDGSESNLPTKTCTQTDDDFLEAMFNRADVVCNSQNNLIVFVHCHGHFQWGYHVTSSSKSKNTGFGWTNVITANEYKSKIAAITNDGTDVFLWVVCCHGNWMTDWSSSQHNNHLEVWCYAPVGYQQAWNGSNPDVYTTTYWQYTHGGHLACEAERFFTMVEDNTVHYCVTYMGVIIGQYFNTTLHPGESSMYRGCFLSDPHFYID